MMTLQLSERAQFLIDNLDLPEAAEDEAARWEYFQLAHLSDDSTYRIEDKARQIAWSWTIAAEAVANALLYGISSIFQSINLGEAQEKIIYARRIYANLRLRGLPKISHPDTTTSLGFDNGARILSIPGRPHRGKAKFWVYFDEWAHQQYDRENYKAAHPIISKGGFIRGASSPLGASGLFWEIYKEELKPYPGYTRKQTPWWECYSFCNNVREARQAAPTLPTFERVERYGTDRLKAIYANTYEEDFKQEHECEFVDESTAWITWDEIKANQDSKLICFISRNERTIDNAKQAIDLLAEAMRLGRVERAFTAGYDVGRTRNTSELFIIGKSTTDQYPLRAAITLDNCEYDDQLEVITYAMVKLPIFSMLIDRNGIGNNLAENAEKRFPGKCQGVDFTNPSKAVWAGDAKMLVQQRKAPLPIDRDIAYQIHSIKKIVTEAKNVVFDTERNLKHHADKFWAWALGLSAARFDTPEPAGSTVEYETADYVKPEKGGRLWH